MSETDVVPNGVPSRSREVVDAAIMGNDASMQELLAHLRENEPVSYCDHPDFEPFWVLTRHEDIKMVSQNNERFVNNPRTVIVQRAFEEMLLEQFGTRNGLETLIHMDNPKHRKLRGVTREWFKPGPISKLRSVVEKIAREHVDKMEALGDECDFVKEIALLYPLRVIMSILGVPREEETMMLRLTQELFGAQDPTQGRGEDLEHGLNVLMEFYAYFQKVIEDRKKNPSDDLASVLANALVDGEPMAELDQISYFIITATAGHDTTSATISGGLKALLEFPDELAKLQADPELCVDAAREMIRWVSPVRHMMRTATEDVVLQGQRIRAGESLALWYPAANRDPRAIPEPNRFDVSRDNRNQLAFGYGGHMCLGQHLAILETECFFRELIPRLKSIEVAGEPASVHAVFVGGLKSLPVRYTFK